MQNTRNSSNTLGVWATETTLSYRYLPEDNVLAEGLSMLVPDFIRHGCIFADFHQKWIARAEFSMGDVTQVSTHTHQSVHLAKSQLLLLPSSPFQIENQHYFFSPKRNNLFRKNCCSLTNMATHFPWFRPVPGGTNSSYSRLGIAKVRIKNNSCAASLSAISSMLFVISSTVFNPSVFSRENRKKVILLIFYFYIWLIKSLAIYLFSVKFFKIWLL